MRSFNHLLSSMFWVFVSCTLCGALCACEEQSPQETGMDELVSNPFSTDMDMNQLNSMQNESSDFELDQTIDDALTQDQTVDTIDQGMEANYPPPPNGYPLFALPIMPEDIDFIDHRVVFGVDHDPSEGQRIRCEDYAGRIFPYCYDGHLGSDFILLGAFETMDQGSARVQSALAGTVIDLDDGNYDRCHADALTADVSCDGYPMQANYVTIEHDNGWRTDYLHLKRNSVAVTIGDRVSCGTVLGLVGSSGYSSAPHLHFEVTDPYGVIWDPFAGPSSQPFSLWLNQPPSGSSDSLPSTSCSSP